MPVLAHGRSPPDPPVARSSTARPVSLPSRVEANMRGHLGEGATVLGVVLLATMMLVTSDTAVGQEKKKISWSSKPENTKFPFRQVFDIPDMPLHRMAVAEIRRTWPDGGGPVIEGLKPVEEIVWAVGDSVAGSGLDRGYSVVRYDNGDQTFGQWHDTAQAVINPDGSRRTTFVGTYVLTGGTGKLKGIKGAGRFSGVAEFDANNKVTRNEYSAEGEYWFEK
jgi:hypothetical protein